MSTKTSWRHFRTASLEEWILSWGEKAIQEESAEGLISLFKWGGYRSCLRRNAKGEPVTKSAEQEKSSCQEESNVIEGTVTRTSELAEWVPFPVKKGAEPGYLLHQWSASRLWKEGVCRLGAIEVTFTQKSREWSSRSRVCSSS